MGFTVQIEADYRGEILTNYPSGGKAVFAFLTGLSLYADSRKRGMPISDSLYFVMEWHRQVEQNAHVSFFPTCDALLECMWGDGGESIVWRDDEYDFFVQRSGGNPMLTKTQFVQMVQDYDKYWQSITEVIDGVELLLKLFSNSSLKPLEGFYEEAHTIPDFEALLSNLILLRSRGNTTVRLNFS